MTHTEKFANLVAKHYHGEENLAAIDPATIEMIIMIILEVINRCKNRPDPNNLNMLQRVRLRFTCNRQGARANMADAIIAAAQQTEDKDLDAMYEENSNWLF